MEGSELLSPPPLDFFTNFAVCAFEPINLFFFIRLRLKCEKEISDWVNHVTRQAELAGKDLTAEMEDMMHNKLEGLGQLESKTESECFAVLLL